MNRRISRLFVALGVVTLAATSGCAATPSRHGLITKLEHKNGLSTTQARCVADGLYDGMPKASPATRALTTEELRAVAKPDNAGKVSVGVIQIMRDVVSTCVPNTTVR